MTPRGSDPGADSLGYDPVVPREECGRGGGARVVTVPASRACGPGAAKREHEGRRPLLAVGYGPRCVPVLELAQAATGLCDLVWVVDESLPEMRDMGGLLDHFGVVLDLAGRTPDSVADDLASRGVVGIVTYLDAGMVTLAEVAALLDLPFHAPAVARSLVDKARQREVLRDAGVEVPECTVLPAVPGAAALAELKGPLHWPAVLKPRSSQGSRWTFFARDASCAASLLDALGPDRPEMIMEEYIEGDPERAGGPYADYVSVESIVARGVVSHLAVTGRFPLADNFRETGFFIPAALGADERAEVVDAAGAAIDALKVRTGCLHTEVKLTSNGPRIIEVNGRVGGGVPEMLERAAGISLLELSMRVALGEEARIAGPVRTERIGYRFFLQPPAVSAIVATIEGVDAVTDLPQVDSVRIHSGPGTGIEWWEGSRSHILAVLGSARGYEELLAVERLLRDDVTVTYEGWAG